LIRALPDPRIILLVLVATPHDWRANNYLLKIFAKKNSKLAGNTIYIARVFTRRMHIHSVN